MIIGTSAGGLEALSRLLPPLPPRLPFPLLVVLHRLPNVRTNLVEVLQDYTTLPVSEVRDKQALEPGQLYLAPANYHVLVERDQSLSLSVSEPVNFSRPSIDVTLVSAAEVYGPRCTGIILTGASPDGARGMKLLHDKGGRCLVQSPAEAVVRTMPEATLHHVPQAEKMTLDEIKDFLCRFIPPDAKL